MNAALDGLRASVNPAGRIVASQPALAGIVALVVLFLLLSMTVAWPISLRTQDDWASFIQYSLNGLTLGGLYFLVASGFTLIFGLMRVVNLAHGTLYLFGAYLGYDEFARSGSWVLGVIVGALAMGVLGVLMQQILLRPIQGQDLREALVTIGFSIVVADLLLWHYGGVSYQLTAPDAINGATNLHVLGLFYPTFRLFVLGLAFAVFILLWLMLTRTKLGMIVRAAIDDRAMVSALGINIQLIFALLFALGAALAGLGGVMGASFLSVTNGDDATYLLASLIVVIVGGLGSLEGAAIGALLLGLANGYGFGYAPTYTNVIIFLGLVVVLALRPQGFLGRAG
jgi:branched-chain amino acid transport system permease protein